jgi:hypothetical protein
MECMNKDQLVSDIKPNCCKQLGLNNDEHVCHCGIEDDTEHNTLYKTFTSHGGFVNDSITTTQILNTTTLHYTVS